MPQSEASRYYVRSGYYGQRREFFETFEEALAHYRKTEDADLFGVDVDDGDDGLTDNERAEMVG